IIQQSNSEHNVVVPEIYLLDSLELNSNSVDNIKNTQIHTEHYGNKPRR
ncbi:2755_t:CDS:1, partial [Racocetra persica]